MHLTLLMVSSINGFTTLGENSQLSNWTSSEDFQLLQDTISEHNLLVMGRQTYQAAESQIRLTPEKLRVILTRTPQKFQDKVVPNQLEFTNQQPAELIKSLQSRGYNRMLLLGGSYINSLFLEAKVINELHLTIEPKLFSTGQPLFQPFTNSNVDLQLIETKQLNTQGSLHLRYQIKYTD